MMTKITWLDWLLMVLACTHVGIMLYMLWGLAGEL